MIIFGTRGKVLKSKNTTSYDCENCNSKNTVTFSFIARYFHIFWIPIFPTSKKGISQCSHCKQVLYANEMSTEMKQDYASAAANAKRPITHYFGLFIIGLLFIFISFSVYKNSLNEAKYLGNPQVDDVYKIEKNGSYTLYKVSEIKGDSLIFATHKMVVKKYLGLSELEKKYKNDYSDEKLKFTVKQIESMKNDSKSDFGKIYSIERD